MNSDKRNSNYLFNYAFLAALGLLAVNDHILKAQFGNAITGKLSDVTGMIILPLFLAFVFRKLKTHAVWVSMLLFAFYKSEFSQGVLNFIEQTIHLSPYRVIDYTDLWAFAVAPLPYYIIAQHIKLDFLLIKKVSVSPTWLVVPCIFILVATSPPRGNFHKQYRPATGNIVFKDVHVTFSLSKEELLRKLANKGLFYSNDPLTGIPEAERDTVMYHAYKSNSYIGDTVSYEQFREQAAQRWERGASEYASDFYKIKELIINNDTIRDLQFYILHTERGNNKVYLNSIVTGKDLSDKDVKERETKRYKKLLKKYFKNLD